MPVLLVFSLAMFLMPRNAGAPAAASRQELCPWERQDPRGTAAVPGLLCILRAIFPLGHFSAEQYSLNFGSEPEGKYIW